MMRSEQFCRIRRLALRVAGIALVERHRELLHRRGLRLGLRDGAGLDLLLEAVEAEDPAAIRLFLRLVTTSFTGFFRHPRHFDIAAEHALWAAHRRGRARLWSAAAATGEEPYSLAIALIEVFRGDDAPAGILATDIDAEALAVAQRGRYGRRAMAAIEPERRARFFSETAGERWQISPAVRSLVELRALNLTGVEWPVEGPFDGIFCRNVLMYLEAHHRYAVLERMASLLGPDGLLILDPTEDVGKAAHWFTPGAEGVYSRRHKVASRRGSERACGTLFP